MILMSLFEDSVDMDASQDSSTEAGPVDATTAAGSTQRSGTKGRCQ